MQSFQVENKYNYSLKQFKVTKWTRYGDILIIVMGSNDNSISCSKSSCQGALKCRGSTNPSPLILTTKK